VLRDFRNWKHEQEIECAQKGQKLDFVIFESAILLESPHVASCADKVLVVSAPYELRIERVMARDGVARGQVEERIARQWSDAQREALADFIIFADSKRALLPQIADVIEKMKGEE
jgi:dephospho-CoA kinase